LKASCSAAIVETLGIRTRLCGPSSHELGRILQLALQLCKLHPQNWRFRDKGELIAGFGEALVLKLLNGKFEPLGGPSTSSRLGGETPPVLTRMVFELFKRFWCGRQRPPSVNAVRPDACEVASSGVRLI